jgi:hypothetical protein
VFLPQHPVLAHQLLVTEHEGFLGCTGEFSSAVESVTALFGSFCVGFVGVGCSDAAACLVGVGLFGGGGMRGRLHMGWGLDGLYLGIWV